MTLAPKSTDQTEFKRLDCKLIGSDTVVFRLEDGAMIKIKVDIDQAGVAVNFRNPDGTLHYNIAPSLKVNVTSPDKKYYGPKPTFQPPKESTVKPI